MAEKAREEDGQGKPLSFRKEIEVGFCKTVRGNVSSWMTATVETVAPAVGPPSVLLFIKSALFTELGLYLDRQRAEELGKALVSAASCIEDPDGG